MFREYHQIDASVYLKAIEEEIKGDSTVRVEYITKLGRTYGCAISIVILGEIVNKLCQKAKDKLMRDEFLTVLGDFLVKQEISVITILGEDIKLFNELREIETRAHEPEILALAAAINHKADVFMTFDEDLLHSAPLFKQKYGIKVRKPV